MGNMNENDLCIVFTTNDDRIRQHNETYLNVIVIFTTLRRKISDIYRNALLKKLCDTL